MSDTSMTLNPTSSEAPESALEHQLIAEFLRAKGYQISDLASLPKDEADALMKAACRYASFKLAEVEARSKLRRKIEAPW